MKFSYTKNLQGGGGGGSGGRGAGVSARIQI